jgi:hypothetical protein
MNPAHRHRAFRATGFTRLSQSGAVALAGLLAVPLVWAGFSSSTSFEVYQRDQLSGNLDFEEATDTDSAMGTDLANVSGSLETTFQSHQYATTMGGLFNAFGDSDVNLFGTRSHTLDLTGEFPTAKKWNVSTILYTGQSTFTDQLAIAPGTGGVQPAYQTVDFVWNITGLYSQQLDLDVNQQPLYRITDRLQFSARDVGGNLYQPAVLDVTTFDTDANPADPRDWSTLDAPVNFRNAPVPLVNGELLILSVTLGEAVGGGFRPVSLEMTLDIESHHNFLNDGPQLNYDVSGFIEYHFANSADLVGLIIRDSTGAVRTDAIVTSQEGVVYTIIPEPGTIILLCFSTPFIFRRRRRQRWTAGEQIPGCPPL